jgi:hypothetical protein
MNEWLKNIWSIHNGVIFTLKKERSSAIYNNMDGTGEYYAK